MKNKKDIYLLQHRKSLCNSADALTERSFGIIGFGAYHGSSMTEQVELALLKRAIVHHGVRYYIPEVDYCLAYYFTIYLRTGDIKLLYDLIKEYSIRVPQEGCQEIYCKWQRIREFCVENNISITVLGIDKIYSLKYVFKYIQHLLLPGVDIKLRRELSGIECNGKNQKDTLLQFVRYYKENKEDIEHQISDMSEFNRIIKMMEQSINEEERDFAMYRNYTALYQLYNLEKTPQFIRMGFAHIMKSADTDFISFFAHLVNNAVYPSDKIISIAGYLVNSKVFWGKTNSGRVITKGNFGIGDAWYEHFSGIHRLKKNAINDCTLFDLTQPGSPYRNSQDLIKICGIFKLGQRQNLRGKNTSDFIDYAILIQNSAQNTPL